MQSKKILLIGLLTITLFPLVAFVIHFFFSTGSFLSIFLTRTNILYELLIGTATGLAGGYIGWKLINFRFMFSVREKYQGLIYSLRLNLPTIIIVSICAGVGEEILFRGVLQPFFGIWITAVFFVAIHGYLSPKDWKISIYGTFMVLLIALLGYMTEYFGLTTAMTAHTFIDVVLFYQLTNNALPEHSASSDQSFD